MQEYDNKMKQLAFIVGTGRSGTTLLAQVLNSHTKICVPPELQFIASIGNGDRFYDKFLNNQLLDSSAEDFIGLFEQCCSYDLKEYFNIDKHFRNLQYPQTNIINIYTDLFNHLCFKFGKDVLIKQTPWYGQKLLLLKSLFPKMKIIHMIRDGRDVAISFAKSPWWKNDVNLNLQQWYEEANQIHYFGKCNPSNYIEVKYEDFIEQPNQELAKIMQLLNLSEEDEMLNYNNFIDYLSMFKYKEIISNHYSDNYKSWDSVKEQTKSPFFKDSVYSWKRNKDYDFSNLPSHIKDTLNDFGYET